MHQYLIVTPRGYRIHSTEDRYGHHQRVDIEGHQFESQHYYKGDGPYGILIRFNDPVSQEIIRDAIHRSGIKPLP